ncbi:MAG: DUF309 domain-containing protein [Planctomycetota bacterium]|jgi:hypothetical protein|nr:DUF309 domain-containing protein [Planctomycetota bacterium]MDP6941030.1 DUF309 domain-containing protein [Planctomycetota bacterium]
METPPDLLAGIQHFNRGEWYDAHEAWEEPWTRMGGSGRNFYKGLIQIAVGLYHWENHNPSGAYKLTQRGIALLTAFSPDHLGVPVSVLIEELVRFCDPLQDWDGVSVIPFPETPPPKILT